MSDRIFKDEEKLRQMLNLRRVGWSFHALAEKYNCHVDSIKYQCGKHEVEWKGVPAYTKYDLPKPEAPKGKYDHLIYEKMNQGRMYKDYFQHY